jgi:hypothetical protein
MQAAILPHGHRFSEYLVTNCAVTSKRLFIVATGKIMT